MTSLASHSKQPAHSLVLCEVGWEGGGKGDETHKEEGWDVDKFVSRVGGVNRNSVCVIGNGVCEAEKKV